MPINTGFYYSNQHIGQLIQILYHSNQEKGQEIQIFIILTNKKDK